MNSHTWFKAVPPDDQRGPEAACGVHRCAGDRDAYQVRHGERQANDHSSPAILDPEEFSANTTEKASGSWRWCRLDDAYGMITSPGGLAGQPTPGELWPAGSSLPWAL